MFCNKGELVLEDRDDLRFFVSLQCIWEGNDHTVQSRECRAGEDIVDLTKEETFEIGGMNAVATKFDSGDLSRANFGKK